MTKSLIITLKIKSEQLLSMIPTLAYWNKIIKQQFTKYSLKMKEKITYNKYIIKTKSIKLLYSSKICSGTRTNLGN